MKNRHFFCLFLCVCMVVSLFSGFTSTASAANDVLDYVVAQGDYLFKVCKAHGLDYYQCKQAIMALNGFTSDQQLNKLSVGQKIKLPASNAIAATVKTSTATTTTVTTTTSVNGTTTTTTSSSTVAGAPNASGVIGAAASFYLVPHKIASGETLNGICNGLGTNYYTYQSMILGMNGISNAANITAGKTVYIPSTTPVAGGYSVVEHTVVSGETLTSICTQYGVNYNSNAKLISGLNAGKDISRIYVGQKVYIPTTQSVAAPSGVTIVPAPGTPSGTTTTVTNPSGPLYEISFDYSTSDPCAGPPYAMVNNVNVSKAAAGSTVIVGSNTTTSKALSSIDVTRGDNSIRSTFSGNSFVMPACNVRVKCNYTDAFAVIKDPATNGSYFVNVNGAQADYALAGDKISITVSPNSGYSVSKVEFDGVTLSAKADGSYAATMPAHDARVKVSFGPQVYYKLTWSNATPLDGSFVIQVNGTALSNTTSVAPGQLVTIICTPKDYYESIVTVTPSLKPDRNGQTYSFKMPAADTSVAVKFQNNKGYAITADSLTGGGTLRFSVYGNIQTEAIPGQTVTVLPEAAGAKDFDYAFVRFADLSATVPMSGLTFTMPAANVVVYGQFKDGAQKYTIFQHPESGCGFGVRDAGGADRLTYSAGEVVHLGPGYDSEKYKVSGVYWLDSSGAWQAATNNGNNDYTFTMPAYDVQIKAVLAGFENWVTVTLNDYIIDAENGVRLTASINGNSIASGTQVKNGSRIDLKAEVYGNAPLYGFSEDGVNNLIGLDDYNCYYIVSAKDGNITFSIRNS